MVKKDISFYFPYVGGKSRELPAVMKYIDMSKIESVVEPFCGSCVFSTSISKSAPALNFHVNDIDEQLTSFLQDVKQNGSQKYIDFCHENWEQGKTTRDQYNTVANRDDAFGWFYRNKIYQLRRGFFPNNRKVGVDGDYKHLDNFFMSPNVRITNDGYESVINNHREDENCVIFLDPPYFLSDNEFYKQNGRGFGGDYLSNEEFVDPTANFCFIRDVMKTAKAQILMVINECELLKDYYRDFFKESYPITYQMTRKKSRHMILSNR